LVEKFTSILSGITFLLKKSGAVDGRFSFKKVIKKTVYGNGSGLSL